MSSTAESTDETGVADCVNEYGYTNRPNEFTSELYKIEVDNLPRTMPFQAVKALFSKTLGLKVHKIKLGARKVYVTFDCEADRDSALKTVNGYNYRNTTLEARLSTPKADPVVKRRKLDSGETYDDCQNDEPQAKPESEWTEDDINDQICSLWRKPYNEQLEVKHQNMCAILVNISKQIRNLSHNLKKDCYTLFKWWSDTTKANSRMACVFEGVKPSPLVNQYRNKCEFTVGSDGVVGFKCGKYESGLVRVMRPPQNNPLLSELMFKVIDLFRNYLQLPDCKLEPFDQVKHSGNLRQVTVRTNTKNEVLVLIDMHPQDMSDEDIDIETKHLVGNLTSNEFIKSIFLNVSTKLHMDNLQHSKLIHGPGYLTENLCISDKSNDALAFKVGPLSFFQVNTPAANILYKTIADMAELNENSFVLDIGCGTGTIALTLARGVTHVIGIDISESSIKDAKQNAKDNEIENATFFKGRAEDLIDECLTILKSFQHDQKPEARGEIVAIIDPPRNGLNSSLIKSLRSSLIQRIVYVSCDPRNNRNLIDLCRPQSKAYQREPFVPTKAVAIDLFPHTELCELVLMYERLKESENEQTNPKE